MSMKVWRNIEPFFFAVTNATGFGLMRIAWALTAFAFLLLQWSDVVDDYSVEGFLPPSIEALVVRQAWRITIFDYVDQGAFVFVMYLALLILLILSALGVFTRLSTVLSVALIFSFHERNTLMLSGGDTVIRNVGFILAVAPCVDGLSVDRVLARRRQGTGSGPSVAVMPMWPVRLLQWQLIVIYVTAAWWKLLGSTWLNGTAIAILLHHPRFARVSPQVTDRFLVLAEAATAATLLFEGAWLFLLVPRSLVPKHLRLIPLKRVLIATGMVFHLAIFVLLDVGSFSFAMIACYFGLLTEEDFEIVKAVGWRWQRRTRIHH
jgi:hypothetical protein